MAWVIEKTRVTHGGKGRSISQNGVFILMIKSSQCNVMLYVVYFLSKGTYVN